LDAKTTDGIVYRKFSLGEDTYAVAAGDYVVTIARGLDYEVCRKAFTLEAGKTADFSCEMKKVVDAEGYGAIDLHMHTELSVDAQVPVERRIVQFMAEGLEAVSVTDHDRITDLRPLADSIMLLDGKSKASSLVSVFPGCEISPTSNHYNMHS
jgi:DNA polymerase III alpha subunit (gram-positive type)